MNRVYLFVICMMSFVGLCFSNTEDSTQMFADKPSTTQTHKSETNPVVLIETTMGNIKIQLDEKKAPLTVKNFLEYTKEGHYDNTIFHRVIDGFMIQGGGFTKDFQQKATKTPIDNEGDNGLTNKRGTIAMARTSDPKSATAQFFINVTDNPFLDFRSKKPSEYGYCVFGKVTEGLDVVDRIKKAKTGTKGPFENVPLETIEILKVRQLI